MTAPMTYELAPVYDMGSSLFSKRSPSVAARRLGDEEAEREDAFGTNVSCYRLPDGEGGSVAIHPFEYMAKTSNPDLTPPSSALRQRGHGGHRRTHRQRARGAYGVVLYRNRCARSTSGFWRKRLEEGILPLS